MKSFYFILACLISYAVQAQIKWPDGKKAAIVLTYDDGLASHRNIVVSQLDKKGMKGTFFLYGQTISWRDMPEWKRISSSGHELGNHSVYHPCLEITKESNPCTSLEYYTVQTMLREIAVMNQFLYGIDGRDTIRTYAYPCGQTITGGEDYSVPLERSGLISFARGGGGNPVITDLEQLNHFKVPALAANTGESSERLINFIEEVVRQGGLGVFIFHGVGGDYLDISAEVHQEIIDYLDDHASDIWVAPFREVMEYISTQNKNKQEFADIGTHLFDSDWKFMKGDIENAESYNFDDSDWRSLTIPHDWGIEPHPIQDETHIGPFVYGIKDSTSTGNIMGGTGWYRKDFTLKQADIGKTFQLYFDGVSVQSDVWINGEHIGFHPNGYTSFYYDLTPYLKPVGEKNIIAIKTFNTGINSRWYTGAGLYRHIWLLVSESVYIEPWGLYVATPRVDTENSQVDVSLSIYNNKQISSKIGIRTTILDPDGMVIDSRERFDYSPAGEKKLSTSSFIINNPHLWSPDSPSLYTVEVRITTAEGRLSDIKQTRFGIRSLHFSAEKGFLLNGKETLLKGACIHHDNGLLGSATFDRAEIRKVELLKKNGFNAIRTAHNLPSTQFLDACDSLGMLVIDEAFDMWKHPKRDMDYHLYFEEWCERDISSMVLRDRNHPSVIIWSIGNEIYERADSSGLVIAKRLINQVKVLDNVRPVTQAICALWQIPSQEWDATIPAFGLLDIGSYNYEWKQYERDHQLHPERIMIATESFPREAYINWQLAKNKPYVIGDFVWTGMDYIGEVGIGNTRYGNKGEAPIPVRPWPWYLSWCGDIDIIGNKKPQSYYRDVVWENSELELLVHAPIPNDKEELVSKWGWPDEYAHWNWNGYENVPLQVSAYTSCDSIMLYLNNKLIDRKTVTQEDNLAVSFSVPYQPGELKASGFRAGKEIISKSLITTGKPSKIKIIPERYSVKSDPNDLAYIQIIIVDDSDKIVPDAAIDIQIIPEGNGELIACGNAAPDDLKSFGNPQCKTFRGRALAIMQPKSKGSMTLTVKSELLPEAKTEILVY